jgi:predicted O-linked N-acetylglucosamine transferase (SPINDLY family)
VVLDVDERNRESTLDRFVHRDVDPARVTVRERQSLEDYYYTLGDIDVAFDTFPYNGATTTLDTLWMGTPVVALRGNRGIARGSYSILSSLPLPELVARSPDEYVAINLRLANDHAWRSELRATLRPRLSGSRLMDAAGFVSGLEAAYREMWKGWCELHAQSGS